MSWKLFRVMRHPAMATLPVLPSGAMVLPQDTGAMHYSDGSKWIPTSGMSVGAFYVQYPDESSNDDAIEFPLSQRPASLFGGTWAEQWATESIYFRTRGALSDSGRTNGKQEDAIQVHRHQRLPSGAWTYDMSPGVVWMGNGGSNPNTTSTGTTTGDQATGRSSSNETRVVNRRIKVWKRIA